MCLVGFSSSVDTDRYMREAYRWGLMEFGIEDAQRRGDVLKTLRLVR